MFHKHDVCLVELPIEIAAQWLLRNDEPSVFLGHVERTEGREISSIQ